MNLSTEDAIFYGVLGFGLCEYLWECYLDARQRRIYRNVTQVPKELAEIMDHSTFEKARLYALDKSSFGNFKGIFNQILSLILMWFYGFKIFWDAAARLNTTLGLDPQSEIYRSISFVFLFNVFNTIIGLPFSVYGTFVLEQKHGFNKQTPIFYIKDQIKSFFIGQIITFPLVAAIIWIIQSGGEYFFIYLWLFTVAFTLFMMVIYPEFIAPLFDKYIPLPEGELRKAIEDLAASIEFPLYKLFVVEGSKRSSHSNAYFYGFFNFKRIVLFDTLLEKDEREKVKQQILEEEKAKGKEPEEEEEEKKEGEKEVLGCNMQEILAVLGHELGHWKLNHVLKNLIISEAHIFLMFALFAYLFKIQALYSAFGFTTETPILIGLMIILQFITAPYNSVLEFAMTCLSRRFEFQADTFAIDMDKGDDLKTALVKLNNDNLGFPVYDDLYSAFHHSHPPLLIRLAAIERQVVEKKKKGK